MPQKSKEKIEKGTTVKNPKENSPVSRDFFFCCIKTIYLPSIKNKKMMKQFKFLCIGFLASVMVFIGGLANAATYQAEYGRDIGIHECVTMNYVVADVVKDNCPGFASLAEMSTHMEKTKYISERKTEVLEPAIPKRFKFMRSDKPVLV